MRLKFAGLRSVVDALSPALSAALASAPGSPSLITWVPLARSRRRTRGYDQAAALALAVSAASQLPARALLRRTRETAPQARRSGAERRHALQGAFEIMGSSPPRDVVLIDDVLTSGATAAECAKALRCAGAKEVGVVTVARSLGGPLPARCYNAAVLPPGLAVAASPLLRSLTGRAAESDRPTARSTRRPTRDEGNPLWKSS